MATGRVSGYTRRGRNGKTHKVREHKRELGERVASGISNGIEATWHLISNGQRSAVSSFKQRQVDQHHRQAMNIAPTKVEYARSAALRGAAGSAAVLGSAAMLTPLAFPAVVAGVLVVSSVAAIQAYRSKPQVSTGWWTRVGRATADRLQARWRAARENLAAEREQHRLKKQGPALAKAPVMTAAPPVEVTKITLPGQEFEPEPYDNPRDSEPRPPVISREDAREEHLQQLKSIWLRDPAGPRSARGVEKRRVQEEQAKEDRKQAAEERERQAWAEHAEANPGEIARTERIKARMSKRKRDERGRFVHSEKSAQQPAPVPDRPTLADLDRQVEGQFDMEPGELAQKRARAAT